MDLSRNETMVMQSKLMFHSDYTLALKWLDTKGVKLSVAGYYKILKRLNESGAERLFHIGQQFPAFHADEIEKFLMIESQLYEQYYTEKEPINKARILKMIADIQPLITSLYDSTQYVLETNAKFKDILSRREKESTAQV